jgi:aryl-alcohol dehydrogenase-like predicted oxidoreductase
VTGAIVGLRSAKQADGIAGAAGVNLSAEELLEMNSATAERKDPGPIAGIRSSESASR